MTRICSTCRTKYPVAEGNFNTNGYSAAGNKVYRASCKVCEAGRGKQVRSGNPLLLERQREARRKRKCLDEVKERLTEVAFCKDCGKSFVVTVLPERYGSIVLTCQSCLTNPAQQGIKNEEVPL